MSGGASHDINSSWRLMVSSSVGKRNAQEGTNTHGMQLHGHDIAVTHFWD